ncbi:unnamed protein product [Calicophoron daubneyi]|uniref:Aquaporin-3 n=1 Tax=Calicophoron daubneyi TaxID=300641 RepID=A0AAV2SW15_CALDB
MKRNAARSGLQRVINKLSLRSFPLLRACLAEFCGTLILILLGCGVMAQVMLGNHGRNAHGGFFSVGLGWGMAVTVGVFFSGVNGSGHINPAITLAFACIGKLPFRRVIWYILSQIAGSFVGSLCVYVVYREKLLEYVESKDAGKHLVETTGGIFVTNPGASHWTCLVDQVMSTALLAAGVLAMTDPKGWKMPKWIEPLYVGFLIYTLVGCFALNCGAAMNPARDLGPRLMILMLGWGGNAFSAGNYFFWIPIVGPVIGAILGSVLYELTTGIHMDKPERTRNDPSKSVENHLLENQNSIELLP